MNLPTVTLTRWTPDGRITNHVRLSPWPAEQSPEMRQLHAEFDAALEMKDRQNGANHVKHPGVRVRLSQFIRRLLHRLRLDQ